MRAMTWMSAVLMLAVACKKGDEKKAEAPPKMVEKQNPEPAPVTADITVTSKSPEAIKAFEAGRDLFENARGGESPEHFQKALELDPEFAQAMAYLGAATPGAKGEELLTKAASLMTKLPEAEQQQIIALQAQRAGEPVKAKAAFEKILELAPGAWRADLALGFMAYDGGDAAGSLQYFEHALAVKSDLPLAYNGIAYAHVTKHEWDPAIAAAKKQVELLPKQPNPLDTLGEVLLYAGKFEESEKEFAAAVALEPKFSMAWQGVGLARAYRGDFKGAHEAFDKRKASTIQGEKLEAMLDDAWLLLAEGKLPQALAAVDAVEKEPGVKDLPIFAFAAIHRAHMLAHSGKYADAAKAYATAQSRAEALPGGGKNGLMRGYRAGLLRMAALTGKPAPDADKLVAAVEEDAKMLGDSAPAKTLVAYAKGMAAWAKNDLEGAVAELSKCEIENTVCRFDLAAVQRKSGDKSAAEATEKQLRTTPTRDVGAVYVLSRLPKP